MTGSIFKIFDSMRLRHNRESGNCEYSDEIYEDNDGCMRCYDHDEHVGECMRCAPCAACEGLGATE